MTLLRAQIAAEVMEHVCRHDVHGYSQPNRGGDGTTERVRLSDGTSVTIHGGDYDCSELIHMCYVCAGVLPQSSYMWTGNQHSVLTSHGFEVLYKFGTGDLRRGDVLWRKGHTAMYLGNGMLGEANISEHGTKDGTKGDQTGNEVRIKSYYSGWTCLYRFKEEEDLTPTQAKQLEAIYKALPTINKIGSIMTKLDNLIGDVSNVPRRVWGYIWGETEQDKARSNMYNRIAAIYDDVVGKPYENE